jgi:hypothetical protein
MANFDASTPELKAIKKWIEAFSILDTNKMDTLLSRNFKYQSFPKSIDVPEQTKEGFIQWFGGTFSKMKVSIQRQRPSARRLICTPAKLSGTD